MVAQAYKGATIRVVFFLGGGLFGQVGQVKQVGRVGHSLSAVSLLGVRLIRLGTP